MDIIRTVCAVMIVLLLAAIAVRLTKMDDKARVLTLTLPTVVCQFMNQRVFICLPQTDEEEPASNEPEKKPS